MKKLAVLIVGRGRLGRGLGRALSSAAVSVMTWPGRGPWQRALPRVDAVVLAVPDRAVREVAERIAPRIASTERRTPMLHVSGALPSDALSGSSGVPVGVMHPLASIAGVPSPSFASASFVLDGDRRAVAAGRRIARAVGARPIVRALHGARYHAAAALVANGAASLATTAVAILEELGMTRREAERAIGGLLGTVAQNVAALGVPAALTGPIVRGDAATVAMHRGALATDTRALRAYDAVAPLVLETARAAGLDAAAARDVERALAAKITSAEATATGFAVSARTGTRRPPRS